MHHIAIIAALFARSREFAIQSADILVCFSATRRPQARSIYSNKANDSSAVPLAAAYAVAAKDGYA